MLESETVTLTVVYDNNAPVGEAHASLDTAWGFACLIETGETTVLFDTGGDGATLLGNLDALGIDPACIDAVVLSHNHSDHTGGLDALLDRCVPPVIWVPASFPDGFTDRLAEVTNVQEISGPQQIAPGISTLGEMGSAIVEQSVTVETPQGLALITGCAHPGIVEIATSAAGADGLVIAVGGFHLKDSNDAEAEAAANALKSLGVRTVAPTHCTGDGARQVFRTVFGDAYVPVGLGSILVFE